MGKNTTPAVQKKQLEPVVEILEHLEKTEESQEVYETDEIRTEELAELEQINLQENSLTKKGRALRPCFCRLQFLAPEKISL